MTTDRAEAGVTEREAFEKWDLEYRRSTWRVLPSDPRTEMPEHWAIGGRRDRWLGWLARASQPAAAVPRDMPLKCELRDGALRFEIGIDTLCFAVTHCGPLERFFDADLADGGLYTVTDKSAFAQAICDVINRESEDGSTPLTDMLDAAAAHAFDQGCEGVDEVAASPKEPE